MTYHMCFIQTLILRCTVSEILGTFRGLRFTVEWPLTDGNITV